jgi:hypothetical protein
MSIVLKVENKPVSIIAKDSKRHRLKRIGIYSAFFLALAMGIYMTKPLDF